MDFCGKIMPCFGSELSIFKGCRNFYATILNPPSKRMSKLLAKVNFDFTYRNALLLRNNATVTSISPAESKESTASTFSRYLGPPETSQLTYRCILSWNA